ncbi:MAG TPA: lactate utilization protein [Candidatus Paceibacterota bacterium]|nr:lactate utilization protein [Candidatus Paceibacterota bacterium]HQB57092.1 lactate utilization protein [Candidatus Paceibacterota bacterium]
MNYKTIPTKDIVEKTMNSLKKNGHLPEFFETKEEVLERIKELIPKGVSVMNGASRTLEDIGFIEYLKGNSHGWNNLHAEILAEKDVAKQNLLRKQSVLSDFYLGSAHAVTENGEILIASNSGSQLPYTVFTSENLIFVVGVQKITPTLLEAFNRLEKHVIPLENTRMQEVAGVDTYPSKIVILNREPEFMGRKSHILFVNEELGF